MLQRCCGLDFAVKPFFAYVALTQPHLPTEPNPSFKGKTGNGDWADMLAEMDSNVGQLLDGVDKAGVRDNTTQCRSLT